MWIVAMLILMIIVFLLMSVSLVPSESRHKTKVLLSFRKTSVSLFCSSHSNSPSSFWLSLTPSSMSQKHYSKPSTTVTASMSSPPKQPKSHRQRNPVAKSRRTRRQPRKRNSAAWFAIFFDNIANKIDECKSFRLGR